MTSQRSFTGSAALLFAASVVVTMIWCESMSAMGGMAMPGGWTMSMAWMRMPGQSWPGAAASFLGMWIVMMVAMMLPSLVPMLSRYRLAVGRTGAKRLGSLTAIVSAGYFLVWTLIGLAAFPLGVVLAQAEMQWPAAARAVPMAVGFDPKTKAVRWAQPVASGDQAGVAESSTISVIVRACGLIPCSRI